LGALHLAPSQKRAAQECAYLVLIDESGALLAPLVRRTLAPAGCTPVLKLKTTHRERVSLVAGLAISPVRRRLSLHFRTYPKGYVNSPQTVEFLEQLLGKLRGRVIVLWDGGMMHRGPAVREFEARHPRLELHRLPPYAPDLNPVEALWNYLKYQRLANYVPPDIKTLDAQVTRYLRSLKNNAGRLQSFLQAADMPFP
jgi:putative transposase